MVWQNKIDDSYYLSEVMDARIVFNKTIESTAAKFREKVLVHFCEENEFNFISSNNGCSFYFEGTDFIAANMDAVSFYKIDGKLLKQFVKIFKILNIQIVPGKCLGDYVLPITKY